MNNATTTTNKTIRIVFAGTPDFAVPSLQALASDCAADCRLVAVYTQPDRPAGRGRQLRESAVKQQAMTLGLPVRQHESLRDPAAQATLRELEPDLIIVAAYGLMLPQTVLDMPRLGCVNVHASLLPRWRGAAPVQYAMIAGDQYTGITLMQMNAGLDTGAMLARTETPIGADETGGELTARLAQLGGELLSRELANLIAGRLRPVVQDDSAATLAPKIKKSDARIDWHSPAAQIARQVRAFNPWPVAETAWSGRQLRLWSAQAVASDRQTQPGRVSTAGDRISVSTGDGVLLVNALQPAGKRVMTARDFLNAHDIDGQTLGDSDGSH